MSVAMGAIADGGATSTVRDFTLGGVLVFHCDELFPRARPEIDGGFSHY